MRGKPVTRMGALRKVLRSLGKWHISYEWSKRGTGAMPQWGHALEAVVALSLLRGQRW